jgi:hypothetical protein
VLFFGVYGILKYYAERPTNKFVAYTIKYAVFNIYLFGAGKIARALIPEFFSRFSWVLVVIIFEAVFFVYDYCYTQFIDYYHIKLRKILKI